MSKLILRPLNNCLLATVVRPVPACSSSYVHRQDVYARQVDRVRKPLQVATVQSAPGRSGACATRLTSRSTVAARPGGLGTSPYCSLSTDSHLDMS